MRNSTELQTADLFRPPKAESAESECSQRLISWFR